jgi:acetylornithine/succinyldiaminopimelate/putrescine aminotransferase
LLLGVELAQGIDAKEVQLQLLKNGLVTNAVTATALRLAPPLTVSEDEIREAANIIASVLKGVQS